ncbi:hypothetical protein DND58_27710 [Pseudomonas syringae pv. pisi]|uniref:Uncharacterized protein n=1 Tax=Pseudomonas syringae pv. pisi str. 1704B TaxID=629263 RepID=F3G6X2_PSESJ|nr:hypothetical protein PSYPI_10605 [Pseudomonas syringae pv. pisi str. 1704B]PYD08966.1 hypothetical protein DND62_24425 [Pseudomonas syringae pv. pisi]PYD24488.1 hypothetical protein DND58_27710 [Pseudomonas syringae pv. pisi]PYD32333.1 hypothetical protein DND67_14315 [Pseudomonas syringae pv. pisi]
MVLHAMFSCVWIDAMILPLDGHSVQTSVESAPWPDAVLAKRALTYSAVKSMPNTSLLIPAETLAGNNGVQLFFLSSEAL